MNQYATSTIIMIKKKHDLDSAGKEVFYKAAILKLEMPQNTLEGLDTNSWAPPLKFFDSAGLGPGHVHFYQVHRGC